MSNNFNDVYSDKNIYLCIERHKKGETIRGIANHIGCSDSHLSKHFLRLGYKASANGTDREKKVYLSNEQLTELWNAVLYQLIMGTGLCPEKLQ